MKTISREEIDIAWDEMCDLNEEQTGDLIKRFMVEQPALGVYLSAAFESLGEDPSSPLIDIIMCSWQAMSNATAQNLDEVTREQIESAEEANTASLEKLEEASEFEWETTVRSLLESYNQRELLGFGVEMLMSGNEEAPELAPEHIGLELVWIKTVLDCLDQTSE